MIESSVILSIFEQNIHFLGEGGGSKKLKNVNVNKNVEK